jgi:hypothetical protein
MPYPNCPPQFAQLYIHDTDDASTLDLRIKFSKHAKQHGQHYMRQHESEHGNRHRTIMETITRVINGNNPYAKCFKKAGERLRTDQSNIFGMKIIATRAKDPRTHNVPTSKEIAAIIPDEGQNSADREAIAEMRNVDDSEDIPDHK